MMAGPSVFELGIRLTSPALLGGRLGAGGVAETWLVGGPNSGAPRAVLPGSSLRGVLRHASRRFAAARGIACTRNADGGGTCMCPTCQLFGGSGVRGRLRVRTAVAAEHSLVDVTRVAIDRRRGTAAPDALWSSRLVLAAFDVRLELDAHPTGDEPDVAAEHLHSLLGWLEAVGLALGRAKSTSGRAELQVRNVRPAPQPEIAQGDGPQRRWHLQLSALEPLRLASLRDRQFFQHGTVFIPAPTLVGALGWGLVGVGRPDLAQAAFTEGLVWVSEAWPAASGRSWRASARQCERCEHDDDVALAQTAAVLTNRVFEERCRRCSTQGAVGRLRRRDRDGAALFVSGHTAIDATSGRAPEGLLYQQQLCEPGTTFVAEMLAPEWMADALAAMGELTVGGARSRGLGRVRIAVEPAAPGASVDECLQRVRAALAVKGVHLDGDDVAIFDLVTSAHVPGGIERAVAERGCALITGEAHLDVLGGWDERRDTTRALREVAVAGSWLAVRGPAAALAALEGVIVPDFEGWCPLWLRMREPTQDRSQEVEGEVTR